MGDESKGAITVRTVVNQPVSEVWNLWTRPEHITRWNFASDDWHCPSAENNAEPGGSFCWRMEARDGSMGFDLNGTYREVTHEKQLDYSLEDGRKVRVTLLPREGGTALEQTFDPESMNPVEMQRAGWQAILDNFKKYAESQS